MALVSTQAIGIADIVFVVSVFLWIKFDDKHSRLSGVFDLGILSAVLWPLVVSCHVVTSRGWGSLVKYCLMYFTINVAFAMLGVMQIYR